MFRRIRDQAFDELLYLMISGRKASLVLDEPWHPGGRGGQREAGRGGRRRDQDYYRHRHG